MRLNSRPHRAAFLCDHSSPVTAVLRDFRLEDEMHPRGQCWYTPLKSAISMGEQRLGDVIDDHCVKCRRVTNHSIVSLVDGQAAKVRCRTCYHDHDYRHEQAPPSKKDLKKAEAEAALAAQNGDATSPPAGSEKHLKKATAPKA